MVHRGVSINLANLPWLAQDLGVFLHDSWVFSIGGEHNMRNGDLFGILFREATVAM